MAKHKKKKSAPTPDPTESKKEENEPKKEDIPPTEKIDELVPEPVKNEVETADYKKKLDKLFWIRVAFAVIGGIAATFIFEPIEGEERRWASIGFMIILFIVTIGIGKGMKMNLPSSDRKKLVTQAIGSYIFLYLFMWIVSYTIVNVVGNERTFLSPVS
ncbi:MAG TPA: hypothetical protein VLA01_02085 [Nitrosopumilaceae archaeon]|nr:hypothetical protein [Nitrosopumilaceae archaeon]